jgi:sec-independent protein translocase protein TatB
MFDVGFSEVALIAVVAVLVVGPKELPGLIRGASSWLARTRRAAQQVKAEFDRELARADELKRLVEREAHVAELHDIARETGKTIPIDAPRPAPPAGEARPSGGAAPGDAEPPPDRG